MRWAGVSVALGRPSASGGPSGVETSPAPSGSPIPGLPANPAALIAYIQGAGNEASPETYVDAYNTVVSFSTPSGNISCGFALGQTWVTCWIGENTWPSIPTPTCEDGEWGPNWVTAFDEGVRRGGCVSEQPYPMPGEVLPYGSMISIGSIGCRSESTFLACAQLDTGHGFVISKAIYQPYGPVVAYA